MAEFIPSRAEALRKLSEFLPKAGSAYAKLRNYDRGAGAHRDVSGLSPYIRRRIVSEGDVLGAVLGRHSRTASEKFVQEVFWRTYWKGWLEMRPTVWTSYQRDLAELSNQIATQSGLRQRWEHACLGQTGIECFDVWADEIVTTGYLHNHARMWFASIWIFTLNLPWQLGADFFMRHLLMGIRRQIRSVGAGLQACKPSGKPISPEHRTLKISLKVVFAQWVWQKTHLLCAKTCNIRVTFRLLKNPLMQTCQVFFYFMKRMQIYMICGNLQKSGRRAAHIPPSPAQPF